MLEPTFWEAIEILDQKGPLYLVAWAGTDPDTGKQYDPTWVRKPVLAGLAFTAMLTALGTKGELYARITRHLGAQEGAQGKVDAKEGTGRHLDSQTPSKVPFHFQHTRPL